MRNGPKDASPGDSGGLGCPPRKPKGKLVALLAGAVVVVLVAVVAMFSKDIYCHLYLDPRLVGRWEFVAHGDEHGFIEFEKLGSAHLKTTDGRGSDMTGSYRIEESSILVSWIGGDREVSAKTVVTYRIDRDVLIVGDPSDPFSTSFYRRLPDDS